MECLRKCSVIEPWQAKTDARWIDIVVGIATGMSGYIEATPWTTICHGSPSPFSPPCWANETTSSSCDRCSFSRFSLNFLVALSVSSSWAIASFPCLLPIKARLLKTSQTSLKTTRSWIKQKKQKRREKLACSLCKQRQKHLGPSQNHRHKTDTDTQKETYRRHMQCMINAKLAESKDERKT